MMDELREQVIKGLEWILQDDKFGFGENWDSGEPQCDEEEAGKIIWDALSLLKAQEPVKPIENSGFYYCGSCRHAFATHRPKYCSECGREVKWDG